MEKKFFIQAILLIVVFFSALYIYKTNLAELGSGPRVTSGPQLKIKDTVLNIEIADTQNKRTKGLGGRESLATNSGMLFIFSEAQKYPFWMKGVKFPLDFIWVKDQTVVDLYKGAQPVGTNLKDEEIPIYLPNQPVDKVLEVNSGFIEKHQITIDDTIEILNR